MTDSNFVIDGTAADMTGRSVQHHGTCREQAVADITAMLQQQLTDWITVRETFPLTREYSRGWQDGKITGLGYVLHMLERLEP